MAFSLLDLVTILQRRGTPFDQPALLRRLAAEYVVDLPLSPADITAVAAASEWNHGPAHTALARPAWWQHQGDNWISAWLDIAAAARRHSADALLDITKAALYGSIASVSSSQRTRRYQELVVLALIACHNTGEQPPDDLLFELAKDAGPGLAPRPHYVLKALMTELERRSVSNAVEVAQNLLPGVDPSENPA